MPNRARVSSVVFSLSFALGMMLAGGCKSTSTSKCPWSKPDIEGTYRLVSRDLPDGTTQRPPAITGLMTFDDGYRNFNVTWLDAAGKRTSISCISEYSISADRFREKNIYFMMNDEAAGTGPTYDLSPAEGESPVKCDRDGVSWQMPLHGEPAAIVTKKGMTATRPNAFVDRWERVD